MDSNKGPQNEKISTLSFEEFQKGRFFTDLPAEDTSRLSPGYLATKVWMKGYQNLGGESYATICGLLDGWTMDGYFETEDGDVILPVEDWTFHQWVAETPMEANLKLLQYLVDKGYRVATAEEIHRVLVYLDPTS